MSSHFISKGVETMCNLAEFSVLNPFWQDVSALPVPEEDGASSQSDGASALLLRPTSALLLRSTSALILRPTSALLLRSVLRPLRGPPWLRLEDGGRQSLRGQVGLLEHK